MRLSARTVLIPAALCVAGVLFLALPVFSGLRTAAVRVLLTPGQWLATAGGVLGNTISPRTAQTIQELTDERNELVRENARLRSLEQENQEMRELLEVQERSRFTFIAAQVIGKSPEIDTQTLIVDRGSEDGLQPGMPVVASDGFLLGKIERGTARTAVVLLVSDGRSRVAATVLNTERTLGFVEGGRGLGMAFRLIPQHEQVQAGDTVITSGLEEGVPRGLIIGRVGRVSREPQEPFQTATVTQIITPDRRQIVAVIRQVEGL